MCQEEPESDINHTVQYETYFRLRTVGLDYRNMWLWTPSYSDPPTHVFPNGLKQLAYLFTHQKAVVDQINIEPTVHLLQVMHVLLIVLHGCAFFEFDHGVAQPIPERTFRVDKGRHGRYDPSP